MGIIQEFQSIGTGVYGKAYIHILYMLKQSRSINGLTEMLIQEKMDGIASNG
jgi:hypothetical protein